ncbi:MAG: geranylgeranyl reductase family protein [Methanotrichaceae archaeon]
MEEYDVAVIGAGPAGSMAAKYAAENGSSTLLLEEHPSVGWPVQCAGLLGIKAIEESEIKLGRFAIRSVHGATVYSPNKHRVSFRAEEKKGWVVDRRLFDRALLSEAIRSGADFRICSPVTDLVQERGRSLLTVGYEDNRWQVEAKVVISAEGVKAMIARQAGIESPEVILSSAQVEIPFQIEDPDKVEIYLSEKLAPGLFAWAIPTHDGAARIGLSCQRNAYQHLDDLLSSEFIQSRLKGGPVDLVIGGLPIGLPKSTVTDGLMVVGDAAGQVKPTSGGGIYTGLVCAKIAGEVAAAAAEENDSSATRLREYEKRWRASIGRELNLGMKVHNIMNKMTDKERDQILSHLEKKKNLIEIIETYGDIDQPSTVIKKIAPRLGLSDLKIAKMLWRLYRNSGN